MCRMEWQNKIIGILERSFDVWFMLSQWEMSFGWNACKLHVCSQYESFEIDLLFYSLLEVVWSVIGCYTQFFMLLWMLCTCPHKSENPFMNCMLCGYNACNTGWRFVFTLIKKWAKNSIGGFFGVLDTVLLARHYFWVSVFCSFGDFHSFFLLFSFAAAISELSSNGKKKFLFLFVEVFPNIWGSVNIYPPCTPQRKKKMKKNHCTALVTQTNFLYLSKQM